MLARPDEVSIITRKRINSYAESIIDLLHAVEFDYFLNVYGEEIEISRTMAYGLLQYLEDSKKARKGN